MIPSRRHAAAALLLGMGIAIACSRSPTGGDPPSAQTPSITSSVLTAGGEGILRGTHLDRINDVITVDGVVVVPTLRTAAEIRFRMPPGRECEVDGRDVVVRAGRLNHSARLRLSAPWNLAAGESRVLSPESLATLCLQLPGGDARYALTVLNPSIEPSPRVDTLLTVRTWTGADGATRNIRSTRHAGPAAVPRAVRHLRRRSLPALDGGLHSYSEHPTPFDPAHSTAAEGDTVSWIDWWGAGHPDCSGPREDVPTIQIVVAAVSGSGKTVIAYDARTSHGAAWASAAVRARLRRSADIAERWAVPAVQAVMDPNFTPLNGAGGRWFHVFRSDVGGWSVDANDAPQTACRYSSEVPSTVGPDSPPASDAQVEYLAGLLIHEYAHHAEGVYRIRRWGAFAPPTRRTTGWDGIGEAWAQSVQESAARLASGQPSGARYSPIQAPGSGVPFPDFFLNGYGEAPHQSLWSATGGARGGYYDQGVRFLLVLRERWGDAVIGTSRDRLYARAQELPDYDVPSIAALVGWTPREALDTWSLAEATDGLVEGGAATSQQLPQIQSWDAQDPQPLPSVVASWRVDAIWTLSAGRGNYAALYLFPDEVAAGRGISLTFPGPGPGPAHALVRLTRLR